MPKTIKHGCIYKTHLKYLQKINILKHFGAIMQFKLIKKHIKNFATFLKSVEIFYINLTLFAKIRDVERILLVLINHFRLQSIPSSGIIRLSAWCIYCT